MRIDWKKLDPRKWVELSSPVTLLFSLAALLALLLSAITGGGSNRALFSVYRTSFGDLLAYPRLFLHVLGHGSFAHLAANLAMILVLGPAMEAKFGSKRFLVYIAITALVTGLVHLLLAPGTALMGASGVVYMLVMLSAVSGRKTGKVPLTLVLVAAIYLGQEIAAGLFTRDGISQLAHIVGGLCGIGFGLWPHRKDPVK